MKEGKGDGGRSFLATGVCTCLSRGPNFLNIYLNRDSVNVGLSLNIIHANKILFHHYHHQHHHPCMPTARISGSLAIFLYQLKLLKSHLDDTQGPHRVDECKFLQVAQHWCVHVYESIGEGRLWVRPCFFSMFCSSYWDGSWMSWIYWIVEVQVK